MDPPQSSRSELQFVRVTDPTGKDVAQQQTVRKHVMRRYWRSLKNQSHIGATTQLAYYGPVRPGARVELATTCPVCRCEILGDHRIDGLSLSTSCLECGAVGNGYTNSRSRNENLTSSHADVSSSLVLGSPHSVLGSGGRDPFASFPIPTAPYIEFLIRQWVINLTPSLCTLEDVTNMANPVTERLLPLAISDAALFHSLMSFSSSLLDERSGRKTPGTTALFHLGCAIRLLNEALNDTKCAASDKVLATICLVAGHNSIFRDYGNHRRHADALHQLVALRGGLQSLGPASSIYGLAIWVENLHGLYTNTSPRYKKSLRLRPPPFPLMKHPLQSRDALPTFGSFSVVDDGLNNDCFDLVAQIHALTQFMESCRDAPLTPSMITYFYEQRAWIEHRLIALVAESSDNSLRAYEQCVYLAILLYHHTVLRYASAWSGLHCFVLGKLKYALLNTGLLATCWGQDIELLLWILMTAIPTAVEDNTKAWFVEVLNRVLGTIVPPPDLNRIKDIMRKFLWHERISGFACEELYREIRIEIED